AGASQTFTNVARLGQVAQSSTYGNAKPENAIDGNRASNYNQGSCAYCCPERINGAEIRIGNSLNDNGNANPRCAVISSIAAGASQTFACNGMEGRYINIVIPGRTEYLTLCEVESYMWESLPVNLFPCHLFSDVL
uniref:Fucolectin tachylectin-4 pentraxin-1 domain-containing protein n=1 Tax=Maylandia zebra TaxID=106582 RepID=A0A3P9AQV8_9CICH